MRIKVQMAYLFRYTYSTLISAQTRFFFKYVPYAHSAVLLRYLGRRFGTIINITALEAKRIFLN